MVPENVSSSNKKKRKNSDGSAKHLFTLGQEMDEHFDKPRKQRRSKVHKQQENEEYVTQSISNKILREARKQQKEVDNERDEEAGLASTKKAFSLAIEGVESDSDVDDFDGFSESQSHYEEYEDVPEEDEKVLAAFMNENAGPQRTLADLIMEKIREKDAAVSSEERPIPPLDNRIIDVYKGVGKLLSRYTTGKIPKAFKVVPSLSLWEEVLYITEPEKWSANAVYQATRIFVSNLNAKMAQRFCNLVLLPRVREDINKTKRLHFALYQALKKSLYKPPAFFKGILMPLCQSRTCNLREAFIIGSVIQKVSIPSLHSSAGLMKIAEMEYCGTNSYFIKLLLDKKYALPYRVLDALVNHFNKFLDETRAMPVIWHQSLLSFVQRYKNELTKEQKDSLERLVRHQKHYLVTPEILRELRNSRNRGEKEGNLMSTVSAVSVINKTIEEDRWDVPEVPMDED
ncbi:bystin [Cryptomeria japonica]|uniref:bystin n=1 Tax=Cryptomeria japonica TaxID=3369 RepID=UPI0027D9F113|nr:bystin [Cryptomeria japonica]